MKKNRVVILRGVILFATDSKCASPVFNQGVKAEEEVSMLSKTIFLLCREGCFLISFGGFLFGARREGIGHVVSDQDFSEQDFLSLPLGYSFGFESAEPLARLIGN